MDWDDGPIGNMEGVHAFESGGRGDDGAVGVLMVSDNNLSPTTKTQIVEFEVRGPLFDESVVAGGASSSSAVLGDLEGGGGDGATMPSPLRHPFSAALWVGGEKTGRAVRGVNRRVRRVTALVAIGSIVGRWRSAVDARRACDRRRARCCRGEASSVDSFFFFSASVVARRLAWAFGET